MYSIVINSIATLQDFKHETIPNTITFGAILGAFIGWFMGLLPNPIWGMLAGLGLGYGFFLLKLWGGGDAKLLCALGCYKGLFILNYTGVLLMLTVVYMLILKIIEDTWETAPLAHVFLLADLFILTF